MKRKRGQETSKRPGKPRHGITESMTGTSSVDQSRGLSYKPLSRPSISEQPSRMPSSLWNDGNFDVGGRSLNLQVSDAPYHFTSSETTPQSSLMHHMSSQPNSPHDVRTPSLRPFPTDQAREGYPNVGVYPSLPAGAYVNPAFFAGHDHLTMRNDLPPDIQQQIDILNSLQQRTSQ
jgi:hypothetical protein